MECRSVEVEEVAGKPFEDEGNWADWPKGCSLAYSGKEPRGIFWNNHTSGSPQPFARQICIRGTEGRIINV